MFRTARCARKASKPAGNGSTRVRIASSVSYARNGPDGPPGNPLGIGSLEDLITKRPFRQPRPRFRHAPCSTAAAANGIDEEDQRRAADGIHPCRRRGLCRQRHGGWRFGVEAAARQFGLDFVRILTEEYSSCAAARFSKPGRCTGSWTSWQAAHFTRRSPSFRAMSRPYRARSARSGNFWILSTPGRSVSRKRKRELSAQPPSSAASRSASAMSSMVLALKNGIEFIDRPFHRGEPVARGPAVDLADVFHHQRVAKFFAQAPRSTIRSPDATGRRKPRPRAARPLRPAPHAGARRDRAAGTARRWAR